MDLDRIQPQLENFGVESAPGIFVLGALAVLAVILWLATAVLRSMVRFAVAVAEAVATVVAGLSAVLAAGLVVTAFVLTG